METKGMEDLVVGIHDQVEMERSMALKMHQEIKKKDDAEDEKRLTKTLEFIRQLEAEVDSMKSALEKAMKISQKNTLRDRLKKNEGRLVHLRHEESQIRERMRKRELDERERQRRMHGVSAASDPPNVSSSESQREWLIRTGKITPFASSKGILDAFTTSHTSSRTIADLTAENRRNDEDRTNRRSAHQALPEGSGYGNDCYNREKAAISFTSDDEDDHRDKVIRYSRKRKNRFGDKGGDDFDVDDGFHSDESHIPPEDQGDNDIKSCDEATSEKRRYEKQDKNLDDGDEACYQRRLRKWLRERRLKRLAAIKLAEGEINDDQVELYADPHLEPLQASNDDGIIEEDFIVPGDVFARLFEYQKTCVRWLWELYCQEVGGIIGDEMGLGKTIQVIAFLAGLSRSKKLTKPILIVCPATVLRQWCSELHTWWPYFRVVILHSSGSGMAGPIKTSSVVQSDSLSESESDVNSELEEDKRIRRKKKKTPNISIKEKSRGSRSDFLKRSISRVDKRPTGSSMKNLSQLAIIVNRVVENGHVIITTYEGLRTHSKILIPVHWGYCVLDEGHKIRNPDAGITLVCKMVKTPHRIILSGTPIQNNLKELWSLYDFAYPGRLGTLPVFLTQFEVPIRIGAYSNASNIQVQTAHRCAEVLRDLISPYLLRRVKRDVAADLPRKSEQVLFCRLTEVQRSLYERYIESKECREILRGSRNALAGIDTLRKICNHPDLIYRLEDKDKPDYGDPLRSGKLQVVNALLKCWSGQGHRTLVFCQTRQMQDILENLVRREGFRYKRMDGNTPIKYRISMVDEFNADNTIPVFLLTTRVGGLGINLTGADRVIIYDPDWNPSTDIQARERAWRLGQTRDVVVHRLMMSGSIEEKIYHRQIYKQFLTDKVLTDGAAGGVSARRFFDSGKLKDLFSLGDDNITSETGGIFKGSETIVAGNISNSLSRSAKKARNDVYGIDAVEKIEEFVGSMEGAQESKETDNQVDSNEEDDGRILSMLVQSTVAHDVVMAANDPEALNDAAAREARRIAEEAARELRESRIRIRREQRLAAGREGGYAGVVTFTGTFGSAGSSSGSNRNEALPSARSRGLNTSVGNNSSASLLSQIKK